MSGKEEGVGGGRGEGNREGDGEGDEGYREYRDFLSHPLPERLVRI